MSKEQQKSNHITILEEAAPEVQRIIRRTLKLEYEKMYQNKPKVQDDIVQIVQEEIQ